MQIFLALFVVWIVVVLIGHGSWVLIGAIFRVIASPSEITPKPRMRAGWSQGKEDIQATYRVITRLMDDSAIDSQTAHQWRQKVVALEFPNLPPVISPEPSIRAPDASVDEPPVLADLVEDDEVDSSLATPTQPVPVAPFQQPMTKSLPPGLEVLPVPADERMPESVPVLSRSEVIRSFLAAHNIRWGELVAGMLVVICSIGLVINLWSTLVHTHRVIPSLIFLCGNVAIFSVGLYTLSRWKLRHTSRAVLVIATLLVPLSVLAGLAAAGTTETAVQLTDPITIAAIVLGSAVYLFCLSRGGKALVGRVLARDLVLGVAGPAITLPLMPTVVRQLGSGAGWAVGLGAMAVATSSVAMIRFRHRQTPLGVAASRNRILHLAVSVFSLTVLIGYAVFILHDFGSDSVLPVAIASIPALIAIAGSARSLSVTSRHDVHCLVGSVICVIALGLSWVVLPMGINDPRWVWSWATVLAASGLVVGWLLRQPLWLAASTVPLGLAAAFSSSVWFGNASWQPFSFWHRMIAGEPMIATAMTAAIVSAITTLDRNKLRRRWTGYAAIGWASVSLGIASLLTVLPPMWLGTAPWWSVTMVLSLGVLVAVLLALNRSEFAVAASGLAAITWFSIYRPLQLSLPPDVATTWIWTETALAIAITLLVIQQFATARWQTKWIRAAACDISARHWLRVSVLAALVAAILSVCDVWNDWKLSAIGMGVSAAALVWAAVRLRSADAMRLSQVASIATAVVIGYGTVGNSLCPPSAWSSNVAPWYWALLLGAVTVLWFALRELSRLGGKSARWQLGFLRESRFAIDQMADGWAARAATWMIALGASVSFAKSLGHAASFTLLTDQSGWITPLASIALAAAIVCWARKRFENLDNSSSVSYLVVIATAAVVWFSNQLTTLVCTDPISNLILSSSTAATGCGVLYGIFTGDNANSTNLRLSNIPLSAASALIFAASAVLLTVGWIEPISKGLHATALPTLTVASWWAIVSIASWILANRRGNASLLMMSAVLLPLSCFMVVPVQWQVSWLVGSQVAALTLLAWVSVSARLIDIKNIAIANPIHTGAYAMVFVAAISTSLAVCAGALSRSFVFDGFYGPVGVLLSMLVIVLWCLGRLPLGEIRGDEIQRVSWPLGCTLLAGQAAWLACFTGLVGVEHFVEVMVVIWSAAASVSALRYAANSSPIDFWHAGIMTIVVSGLTVMIETTAPSWFPWIAVAVCVTSGMMIAALTQDKVRTTIRCIAARALGWFVLLAGSYFLLHQLGPSLSDESTWTVLVGWFAAWVVVWRILCLGQNKQALEASSPMIPWVGRVVPDLEVAVCLLFASLAELVSTVTIGHEFVVVPNALEPVFAVRVFAFVLVAVSAAFCSRQRAVWPIAFGLFVVCTSLISVRLGFQFDANWFQRLAIANISSGFVLAVLANTLPSIRRGTGSLAGIVTNTQTPSLDQLIKANWHVDWIVGLSSIASSIYLLAVGAPAAVTQLTIGAVILVALAIAELADTGDRPRLRHASMVFALSALGLWASVDSSGSSLPLLTASMRWLVVSVLTIPFVLFIAPRMLGERIAERWQPAFSRAAIAAGCAATGSLAVMLSVEVSVRTSDGIEDISLVLVTGVAITLAALSGIAGLIAMASGPSNRWQIGIDIADEQRRFLVLAAQAIAGVTWLHAFLCKPEWALVGLRDYWPYIVMGLAFASVGGVEWARRRGDRVLADTLKQTALYLPLIPVVGFWLSGSMSNMVGDHPWSWDYSGGRVPYELLLAVAAVYYVGVSALWRGWMPRIAAIVLGNVALWIVLVQHPGWSFLAHPQAWLIPPAVCVLVISHLHRDRLAPGVNSGIRYACTLVIYVSSTADMLLQQIGTSVSGPIILVSLALIGMFAGVVLRVRPFLYLGATFVFIGVTSMVWHATESIDAVWPWWVFGIGTGVALLAALMAIEKNKPKLQRLANSLAAWEA